MTSEQVDTVWTGADAWARRAKAAGDPHTLDQLRVAALINWAESFLTHGDPTHCDTHCRRTDSETVGSPKSARQRLESLRSATGPSVFTSRGGRPKVDPNHSAVSRTEMRSGPVTLRIAGGDAHSSRLRNA